jgi:hypothetical protein
MSERTERYVESLSADLDRFLADFFPRRKWRSRVRYDHRARRFFIDVTLRDPELVGDDRFLSLLAFYSRGQKALLHERAGFDLSCRLYSEEGADLTPRLKSAEDTYGSDAQRGALIGRQIAWLGFRRRLLTQFIPRSLLWAAVIVALVLLLGISVTTALVLCIAALAVQMALIVVTPGRHR